MHQPCPPSRPAARGIRLFGLSLLGSSLLLGATMAGPAAADPLPLPSTDFALKASLKRGGTMDLAHSGSKMRVEMHNPKAKSPIIGLIDLKDRKMVMMMPNVANLAIEIDIPPQYALAAMKGEGTRVGQDQVAGETCDLWKVNAQEDKPNAPEVTACITQDGIAMRTETEINGKPQVLYEVTELTRGPQDPKLFKLPDDVQVMKVDKGKLGGLLGHTAPAGK